MVSAGKEWWLKEKDLEFSIGTFVETEAWLLHEQAGCSATACPASAREGSLRTLLWWYTLSYACL